MGIAVLVLGLARIVDRVSVDHAFSRLAEYDVARLTGHHALFGAAVLGADGAVALGGFPTDAVPGHTSGRPAHAVRDAVGDRR